MLSFMVLLLRMSLRLVLCLWPSFWPWFHPRCRLLTVYLRGRPVHFLMELLAALRPVELRMRPLLHMLWCWLRLLHCRLLIAAEYMLVQLGRWVGLRSGPMVQGSLLQLMHRPAILAWLATTRVLRCTVKLGLGLGLHRMHGSRPQLLIGAGRRRAAGSKILLEIWPRHVTEVRWSVITAWRCGKRRAYRTWM